MPPRNRNYRGPFVQLQTNAYQDDAIRRAGPMAELLFYRSLQLAKVINRDGRLSKLQVGDIARGIYALDRQFRKLVSEKLWTEDPEADGILITQWAKYNSTSDVDEDAKALDAARKREERARAKAAKEIDASGRTVLARIREEERREEVDRPPSGSGRSTSASAAPRSAGGAAHPPQLPSDPGVVSAVNDARRQIAEAKSAWRTKLNKPPIVGNGRDAHVDFSATLAKLTEAAERLADE